MDDLLQVTLLFATLAGAPDPGIPARAGRFVTAAAVGAAAPAAAAAAAAVGAAAPAAADATIHSLRALPARAPSARQLPPVIQQPADSWLGEDKFRHAAASWAAMVFTYATVRAMHDDSDTALAVALPVTAGFGVAKEIADRRRGGPFSFRDLAADALGAGAAWLFLREVR